MKAVQTLCENGFNVDEVRFYSASNKKPRSKPLHVFQAIKNIKLPPTPLQEKLYAIIKCLLQYTNQINFSTESYKPNVKNHVKTKYMSHLMCYLIESEETAVIKELILNKNFVPILRVHYQLYNFIDYTIMKNKINILDFFSDEIENLKDFISSENINKFFEMKNNLFISKLNPPLKSNGQVNSLDDKKIEEAKTLPTKFSFKSAPLPDEKILNQFPGKQIMVGPYTLFNGQKNVLSKRKQSELTLRDSQNDNQFKKPNVLLTKKIKRAKEVNPSFQRQTEYTVGFMN